LLQRLSFIRELDNELSDIDVGLRQQLLPWWNDLLPYIDGLKNDFTWNALPPVVLAAYKLVGLDRSLGLAMANVFKTIHLANCIYCSVRDEGEGQIHDQELQFSILIADYLSGNVIKQLVSAKTSHLLKHLSDMFANINEGLIWQHKLGVSPHEIVIKTRAPLYTTAFRTAAELAGMDEKDKLLYTSLGFNYGMALELMHECRYYNDAEAYYNESRHLFQRLNLSSATVNVPLEKVLIEMHLYSCDVQKAAVI